MKFKLIPLVRLCSGYINRSIFTQKYLILVISIDTKYYRIDQQKEKSLLLAGKVVLLPFFFLTKTTRYLLFLVEHNSIKTDISYYSLPNSKAMKQCNQKKYEDPFHAIFG